jgi:8-oxo-dGTP diphosphatase
VTTTDQRRVATPVVSAAALFLDDQGRVMMLRPHYKPYWDLPGGYVEPGESPRDACRREVLEELGVDVKVGRLLSVDWAPHPDEGDKVLFIFDGGRLTPEELARIRFADGEITEYRFVGAGDLAELTVPRLIRRVRATLEALAQERTGAYLEDGATPV